MLLGEPNITNTVCQANGRQRLTPWAASLLFPCFVSPSRQRSDPRPDGQPCRDEDQVLDYELSFHGKEERIVVLERQVGSDEQNQESADQLGDQQQQNDPQSHAGEKTHPDKEFEEPEERHEPGGIYPVDHRRDQFGDRGHAKDLQPSEPDEDDGERDS